MYTYVHYNTYECCEYFLVPKHIVHVRSSVCVCVCILCNRTYITHTHTHTKVSSITRASVQKQREKPTATTTASDYMGKSRGGGGGGMAVVGQASTWARAGEALVNSSLRREDPAPRATRRSPSRAHRKYLDSYATRSPQTALG